MGKDWLFSIEDCICDVRTAAVLIHNQKILLQRERQGNAYALPGGHIKVGETLENGLLREIMEETGARIDCKRLLWSEECFWEWNGRKTHNLSFYFLTELCDENEIVDDGTFKPHKDNSDVLFGWVPLEQLQNILVYPDFLKDQIAFLEGPIKHFVSYG